MLGCYYYAMIRVSIGAVEKKEEKWDHGVLKESFIRLLRAPGIVI